MRDFPLRSQNQLSQLLQAFRKTRGITQSELANKLGVTQQTLSDLERNAASASLTRLLPLLDALDVKLILRDGLAPEPEPAKKIEADW